MFDKDEVEDFLQLCMKLETLYKFQNNINLVQLLRHFYQSRISFYDQYIIISFTNTILIPVSQIHLNF